MSDPGGMGGEKETITTHNISKHLRNFWFKYSIHMRWQDENLHPLLLESYRFPSKNSLYKNMKHVNISVAMTFQQCKTKTPQLGIKVNFMFP
jgi:hypothetical protein